MITLTAEELRQLYHKLMGTTGERGIEEKLLKQEINRVRDEYGTPEERAAALTEMIISKKIFAHGNTRLGILALLMMLKLNHIRISCTQDELITLGQEIKKGKWLHDDICQWILAHKV